MDELWRLILLSLAMFGGCYLAGSIPLVLTLSERVLRMVTTFGAGLLIGTALIVIIPEGVESLFAGVERCHHVHHHDNHVTIDNTEPKLKSVLDAPQLDVMALGGANQAEPVAMAMKARESSEGYSEEQLHMILGLSLVVGFILMLLVDQLTPQHHGHSATTDVEGHTTQPRNKRITATIGLVVHAAADGLALGAAAGLSKTDVELIIFLAIMLHKAPAAFGFTSFLVHDGYDRFTARKHLLAFALAAPLAAFFSYFGLSRVMYSVQLPIVGVAMLVSAGTFLYVATVHVLSEVTAHQHHTSAHPTDLMGTGVGGAGGGAGSKGLSCLEVVLMVGGALLPCFLNVVHSH